MINSPIRYIEAIACSVLLVCKFAAIVSAQSITVQLVDGRNGKPIKNARVYIAFDDTRDGSLLDLKSSRQGEVTFEAHGHITIDVIGVGEIGCVVRRDYPIDTILKTGFSTWNNCGNIKLEPHPGHLDYFVRPAKWWELFKN